MSVLLEIQKQLTTAQQRVIDLERAMIEHPGLPSIVANLDSAVRIQNKLEAQFADQAQRLGFEVCKYRAFDEYDRPNAGFALGAIAEFQRLISVVYGALKYGYKQRATIPDEVERATAFDFGYAFRGSIGVVLTLRSEQQLWADTELNEAVDVVFSMAKAVTSDEIAALVEQLGPAPVNALYRWAEINAEHGLGAEVEWHRGTEVRNQMLLQSQELSRLRRTIDMTSPEKTEILQITGLLTAADVSKNRFKLRYYDREIKGTVEATAIDEQHRVVLPKTYVATVQKTTRLRLSRGTQEVRYHLLKLEESPKKDLADEQAHESQKI